MSFIQAQLWFVVTLAVLSAVFAFRLGRRLLVWVLLGGIALAALWSSLAVAQGTIRILVDGAPVETDVAPVILNGRVMVPLRAISEALGASIEWDEVERLVSLTTPNSGPPVAGEIVLPEVELHGLQVLRGPQVEIEGLLYFIPENYKRVIVDATVTNPTDTNIGIDRPLGEVYSLWNPMLNPERRAPLWNLTPGQTVRFRWVFEVPEDMVILEFLGLSLSLED